MSRKSNFRSQARVQPVQTEESNREMVGWLIIFLAVLVLVVIVLAGGQPLAAS